MGPNQRRRLAVERKVELRAASGDSPAMLTGYAAVFYRASDPGTQFELYDGVVERIARGAFSRALRERQDVRALFNHRPDALLGRTPKTLRLLEDEIGLRYEIDLADTSVARDVSAHVARGDVTGSSFAFIPIEQTIRDEGEVVVIEVRDVNLFDVGPVTFPAYEATSAEARNVDDAVRAWRMKYARDAAERDRAVKVMGMIART